MFGRGRQGGARRGGRNRPRAQVGRTGGVPPSGLSDRSPTVADRDISDSRGPYDLDDMPGDGIRRLDLGALLVPVLPGVTFRFRVDTESERVTAVVAAAGESTMELEIFAAPRTGGLWDEIRAELGRAAGRAVGAVGTDAGPEPVRPTTATTATTATQAVGEPVGMPGDHPWRELLHQRPGSPETVRTVGIDGPRWFLRATVSGPAALDRGAEPSLETVLRHTVILRGDRAMPVRTALPLRRPTDPDGIDLDADPRSGSGGAGLSDGLDRIRPNGAVTGDARRVNLDVVTNPVAQDG